MNHEGTDQDHAFLLRLVVVALVAFCLPGEAFAETQQTGSIEGRVLIAARGVDPIPARDVAVYLEAVDATHEHTPPAHPIVIEQRDARFVPGFLVVAAGQRIEMPNYDRFMHNAFSYSNPNDFDVGVYPQGESRTVQLDEPGIVRIYCSIHASMRAVVVVSPTSHFARASARGEFRIADVPAGRYRIRTFNEPLPSVSREVLVESGDSLFVELLVGED